LEKLSPELQQAMIAVDLGEATLSIEELEQNRLPELSSDYIDIIEKGWTEHVAKE